MRPPLALVARWYRRLGASNIERLDGSLRPEQPGGRMLPLGWAADVSRRLVSWEHDARAAAVWRYPLLKRPPQGLRKRAGRTWRAGRSGVPVRKQRSVLRQLAAGMTYRQIARRARVSFTTIARLVRAVREWEDPDDT